MPLRKKHKIIQLMCCFRHREVPLVCHGLFQLRYRMSFVREEMLTLLIPFQLIVKRKIYSKLKLCLQDFFHHPVPEANHLVHDLANEVLNHPGNMSVDN